MRISLRRTGMLVACGLAAGTTATEAQLVTLGVGSLSVPAGTYTVLELHVSGPPYLAGFRPYTTISWTDADLSDKPTVIAAAERQYLFLARHPYGDQQQSESSAKRRNLERGVKLRLLLQ